MNETVKNIGIVLLVVLFIVACIFTISATVNMGRLRQVNSQLTERNRQLELANSEYQQRLDSIASRVASAQDAAGRAGDSVSKIRAIVDAIDAISQDLRKPIAVSQP